MVPVASVEAVARVGFRGDVHAIEDSNRQVLLVEQETLDSLNLQPGVVKENITTQGVLLTSLRPGQLLRISDAILQITNECKPCRRMEEIRAGLQELLRGRRGMLARVLRSGTIHAGDAINVM